MTMDGYNDENVDSAPGGYNNENVDSAPNDGELSFSWDDIHSRLKLDAQSQLLLQLFKERYQIASSSEAFAQIPNFLGEYMVREFDYRQFCLTLEFIDEASSDDPALWTAHLSKNLTKDLVAACSLMLKLAMTIAKAHQLDTSDWQDVNAACSNAVRTLPACYRLQRALPGALCLARAWRHLPDGPDDDCAREIGNPWVSEEAQAVFEETHNVPWARIEAVSASDVEVRSSFSGHFKVVEVVESGDISLVSLEAVLLASAPADFPPKAIEEEDVVLCEIEAPLGRLLEKGFSIAADFYEVHSSTCFISGFVAVSPAWVP